MRYYPKKKDERAEAVELNAEKWQIDLLKLNPEYNSWGNFEDYMSDKRDGWAAATELKSWSEHWDLDEYNEVVNFYFEVHRKNHECQYCKGSGFNQATFRISEDFYDFNETGRRWNDKITDDEVYELVREGRLVDFHPNNEWYRYDKKLNHWVVLKRNEKDAEWVKCDEPVMPDTAKVNSANTRGARGLGCSHDAINRFIVIEARARRLGVYGHCDNCHGKGYVYDEPDAKVALQLWVLHPRKGCSKGVYIEEIKQAEIPAVKKYLREAGRRNAKRFSKV